MRTPNVSLMLSPTSATLHEVERAFASLTGALGPIDILVNNAGGSAHRTLARTDPAGWRQNIEGNLDNAYYCAHAVIPGMLAKRSGVIINIGSVNGLSALGDPAYSAAKAAMISLTRSLAQEYGPYGVRANIVLPGTVRTPLWEKRAAKDPQVLETLRRWYPLGRVVEPVDIAQSRRFPGVRRGLGDHRGRSARRLRFNVGQYPDEKGSDARRPLTAPSGDEGIGLQNMAEGVSAILVFRPISRRLRLSLFPTYFMALAE